MGGAYNVFMSNDVFIRDSAELRGVLLIEASRLSDIIDKRRRDSDSLTTYYAYLKDPLINSGILCDDILQGLRNDVVLLALIGTRALLEDAINIHYLESKTDEAERIATAADWFRLSNDPKAYKNKLDDKSVAQRAKEAGKDTLALHDGEYADFCNFTHSTAHRSLLNTPSYRSIVADKTAIATLKAYANILTCVARVVGEATPNVLKSVKDYLDKYRESVIEAKLPSIEV